MNFKPKWLLIILISTVQLVALLLAVVFTFGWLHDVSVEKLGQQACLDNQYIASHIVDSIEEATVRNVRTGASEDLQKLESIISVGSLPNDGFVWVLDHRSGDTLCAFPVGSIQSESLGRSALQPVVDGQPVTTICDSVSNDVTNRGANGKISLRGKKQYVSAQFLPQLNAILVVGQASSLASRGLNETLFNAKKQAFGGTLLLGLLCISVMIMIMGRINVGLSTYEEKMNQKVTDGTRQIVRTKNAVIFGLAKLAESRDNDTGEHLDRIRSYVIILAKDLANENPQIDEQFIHDLSLASSLHDIGKVGIPDSILLKPGRLSPEERGVMELHTLIGGECLDAIQSRLGESPFMHMARQVAYYHHERWDGTGYPHSLKAEEIPLVARIVAVADVYDALTSKRPYKKAMSHLDSREILVSGSGKHFDPRVVEAFLNHEAEFEEVSRLQQFIADEEATSNFQKLCEAVSS